MTAPRPAWGAAAAAASACAASGWHIARHTAPATFDEAWYLEVSYRLGNALSDLRLADFAREYAGAFRFKAPLISLLPLPLYAALGPSYAAARLANLPALALLALSLYRLGRKFFSPAAGALAAAFALMMPMVATLSRVYFVETWLTALTAAFLWRWAESEALADGAEAPRLGVLAGLGLLTKVLFPLGVLGPVALTLWERRPAWKDLEGPLKAGGAVAAAVALTWYGPNLVYVAGYTVRASAGDIAAHYASGSPLDPRVYLGYWDAMARDGFSYPAALLLAGTLTALGWPRVRSEAGLRFALAWLLPPLLIASFGRSKELRFAIAALPGAALALGGALDLLTRGRSARAALFAAALALPADTFARHAFGAGLVPPFGVGPVVVLAPRTVYGGPPSQAAPWRQAELAAEVAGRVKGGAVVALGSEHLYLNANLLASEAARGRFPQAYVNYGHMEARVENTVARLSEKDVTHILFVSGLPPGEAYAGAAVLDAGLKALIAAGKLPFRSRGTLAWSPEGLSAELFERTGPIKMSGAPPR